jgi:dihydroorotate dehydrogenase (fumarate)
MPLPPIHPPLINSANPWATTKQDLQALFDCPDTGAVTTRTSLINGFEHNDSIHQYTFFDPHSHASPHVDSDTKDQTILSNYTASLNTLGYSPIPLATYLNTIVEIATTSTAPHSTTKPFIISVTGSAPAVAECYTLITAAQRKVANPLCMEINLSCPNIPDKPPPAYSKASMIEYLDALADLDLSSGAKDRRVAIGVKTPPYTYHDQFQTLVDAFLETRCVVDFITATNTLGSSLVLTDDGSGEPAINSASGLGIGGMAGAPLHPLALGNVKTIRGLLDRSERLRGVEIIGVGGVSDRAGFERMRAVGAKVIGVGTALGKNGVGVFGKIIGSGV